MLNLLHFWLELQDPLSVLLLGCVVTQGYFNKVQKEPQELCLLPNDPCHKGSSVIS